MEHVEFTEEHCDRLEKLFTDVYVGKDLDNLSIVARLHNLEKRAERFDKTFWAVIILMVGEIVKSIFVHGK